MKSPVENSKDIVTMPEKQNLPLEKQFSTSLPSFDQLDGRKCMIIDITKTIPVQNRDKKFSQKFCIQLSSFDDWFTGVGSLTFCRKKIYQSSFQHKSNSEVYCNSRAFGTYVVVKLKFGVPVVSWSNEEVPWHKASDAIKKKTNINKIKLYLVSEMPGPTCNWQLGLDIALVKY